MDLVLSINYQVLVNDFNGAFVSPLSAIRIKDWGCVCGIAINKSFPCDWGVCWTEICRRRCGDQ
jgi:hypothetical protein